VSKYIKKIGAVRSLRVNEAARDLRQISKYLRPELREELLSICNALLAADCLALPEDDIAVGTDRYFDLPSVFAANEEVAGELYRGCPRLTEQNGGPVVPEAIEPENALDFACRLVEALKADKKNRKAEKKKRIVDAIVGMW